MLSVKPLNLPKHDGEFALIRSKNSSSEAAKLLLKVGEIAIKELHSIYPSFSGDVFDEICLNEVEESHSDPANEAPQERERFDIERYTNVSSPVPSKRPVMFHVVTPPLAPIKHKELPAPMEGGDDVLSISSSASSGSDASMPPIRNLTASSSRKRLTNPLTKDKTKPIRAILRPKFSWKTYPELENYLVEHRARYLQFSSQRNYTREQKRYNNKLTQGLLALASDSGYAFEGFTFAAIRDRIRCYYKSYVQACKKKKRVKRKRY